MEDTKKYDNGFERYSKLLQMVKRKCNYTNMLDNVRDGGAIIRKHYMLDNGLHVYIGDDTITVSSEELYSMDENYPYELRSGKSEIFLESNERLRTCRIQINGNESIKIKYGAEPKYSGFLGREGRDYYYLPTDVAQKRNES